MLAVVFASMILDRRAGVPGVLSSDQTLSVQRGDVVRTCAAPRFGARHCPSTDVCPQGALERTGQRRITGRANATKWPGGVYLKMFSLTYPTWMYSTGKNVHAPPRLAAPSARPAAAVVLPGSPGPATPRPAAGSARCATPQAVLAAAPASAGARLGAEARARGGEGTRGVCAWAAGR